MWLEASSAAHRPFKRSQLDTFEVRGSKLSGPPSRLRVSRSEHGVSPDWQLAWVSVFSHVTRATWYFCFDQWLSGTEAVTAYAPSAPSLTSLPFPHLSNYVCSSSAQTRLHLAVRESHVQFHQVVQSNGM